MSRGGTRAPDGWRSLFGWSGPLGPGAYLLAGAGLMACKVAIDAALCWLVLGKAWSPAFYLSPLQWIAPLPWDPARPLDDGWHWLLFAVVAVPFVVAGTMLTLRRLRDAGAPVWLVALFAVPLVNLGVFVLLGILPTQQEEPNARRAPPGSGIAPREVVGTPAERRARRAVARAAADEVALRSLLMATVAGAAVALAMFWLSVDVLGWYGYGLFLGVPFLQGYVVATIAPRSATAALLASTLVCCIVLLARGAEGILCLLMALPIWIGLGVVGLLVGRATRDDSGPTGSTVPVVVLLPLGLMAEPHARPAPTVFEVVTAVDVAASPEVVWRELVALGELPPPTELPFRLGIAHPVRATLEGHGVGAIRRCTFDTGEVVERITSWEEAHRLAWDVTAMPPSMTEWNPLHDHVDAPHLHGWFRGERGAFELLDLGGGRTRLVGTTWYSHGLWPETYWRLWSDWLLHAIHHRVLDHVRSRAEAGRR